MAGASSKKACNVSASHLIVRVGSLATTLARCSLSSCSRKLISPTKSPLDRVATVCVPTRTSATPSKRAVLRQAVVQIVAHGARLQGAAAQQLAHLPLREVVPLEGRLEEQLLVLGEGDLVVLEQDASDLNGVDRDEDDVRAHGDPERSGDRSQVVQHHGRRGDDRDRS
eukprot:CAMPEP_0195595514 /NCGR_PEP_ID=MMETSP0815-20121206/1979_1 /TAXON_ID=97485 /ORGANISM="Prymnesium parvum, Strain Texoma1" /LENGTH=168 /DNA_ID=CAMNT_0040734767 /DNA_START=556 /DNA_END=1065 /DNA_ORIENTATION=+